MKSFPSKKSNRALQSNISVFFLCVFLPLILSSAAHCRQSEHEEEVRPWEESIYDDRISDMEPDQSYSDIVRSNYVPKKNSGEVLRPFWVITRTDKIEHFPCADCHVATKSMKPSVPLRAHRDIVLQHAPADLMNCATCHNPQNMNTLIISDRTTDFNHSYSLCGRCHFKQESDWKGGAHGKRLSDWEAARVIQTCTGCHNPHDPKFDHRWPVIQKAKP